MRTPGSFAQIPCMAMRAAPVCDHGMIMAMSMAQLHMHVMTGCWMGVPHGHSRSLCGCLTGGSLS